MRGEDVRKTERCRRAEDNVCLQACRCEWRCCSKQRCDGEADASVRWRVFGGKASAEAENVWLRAEVWPGGEADATVQQLQACGGRTHAATSGVVATVTGMPLQACRCECASMMLLQVYGRE